MYRSTRRRGLGLLRTIFNSALSCVFLVTCVISDVDATAIVEDSGTKDVSENGLKQQNEQYTTAEPQERAESTSKTKWIVIGGAAALGLGALALGGGGGGGASQLACEGDLVGPNLAGKWEGVLDLKNYGSQPVTATITHCGEDITITTSSTLPYGQNFSGSISSGGSVLLKEGVTYEIWSTHLGPARSNYLAVYDYVNNQSQLDSLKLSR